MNQVRQMTSMAARRVAYRTGTNASSSGAVASSASSSGAILNPPQPSMLGKASSNVRATQKEMQVHAGRNQTNELVAADDTMNMICNVGFFTTLAMSVFVMGQMISGRGKAV